MTSLVRATLRRRYKSQLSIATSRGYANLVLDMTKYVGTGESGTNRAHIRQDMVERAHLGEHRGVYLAHENGDPFRDAFPTGWGDGWGDVLG